MSHSGCYGPLPGSGHRTLTSTGPQLKQGFHSRQQTGPLVIISESHETGGQARIFLREPAGFFPADSQMTPPPRLSALEASRVPPFPSLPGVSHSLTPSVWTRPQPHPVRS